MRIIRVLHAGSYSIALALAMIGLGGGCDGSSSNVPTSVKETPQDAASRQKTIEDAYKSKDSPQKKPATGK